MPSKKCMICMQMRSIDEKSLCCDDCEEKELDLLITVYAYLHCADADFFPIPELVKKIEPVDGVTLSTTFVRSWLKKQWLEKNQREEVCVPGTVQDELMAGGFALNDSLRSELDRLHHNRPRHDSAEFQRKPARTETKDPRLRMVFMEKHRKPSSR